MMRRLLMNKLTYMKRDVLDAIKHDLKDILPVFYEDNPATELSRRYECNLQINTSYDLPDIELLDKEGSPIADIDAVKSVFGSLKDLPRNIASEECLWVSLCLSPKFWPYVKSRWNLKRLPESDAEKESHFNKVLSRVFFGRNPETRNAISRLWWLGRFTYDDSNNDNPYEITEFVFNHTDFVTTIFERTIGRNLKLLKMIVSKLKKIELHNEIKIDQNSSRELTKYFCAYGGGSMIDSLDQSSVDLIIDRFYDIT